MPEVGQWGPQAFIDRIGRPTPYITVTIYETDGTTPATLYADQGGVAALANPLPVGVASTAAGVDAEGNGTFYAVPGPYVMAVDRAGVEVYRSPVTVGVDVAGGGAIASVNGQTGVVVLNAGDVGADPAGTAAGLVATEASRATTAEGLLIPLAQKGAPSGVATLDGSSLIPTTQLPGLALTSTQVVGSQAAMLALTAEPGDVAVRTDLNQTFILVIAPATVLANWQVLLTPTDAVASVDGRVGVVILGDLYDAAGAAAAAAAAIIDGQVFSGEVEAPSVKASGKTGATATPVTLAGGTATGAPASGTHIKGELVMDDAGTVWFCTVGGTPGLWVDKYGTAILALPSLADGTEITYAAAGSPPTSTLTPVLSSAAAIRMPFKTLGGSTVTSNSSAATLLAGTWTPSASSIAVGDRLVFKLWGISTNTTGTPTFTFRLRYGASTLWTSGAIILVANAAARAWRIEIEAVILSASSGTLSCVGTALFGEAAGAGVNTDVFSRTVIGTDTVVALGGWSAIDFTVQHSLATAVQATTCQGMYVEHLKS